MTTLVNLPSASVNDVADLHASQLLPSLTRTSPFPHCLLNSYTQHHSFMSELEAMGIRNVGQVYRNLSIPQLVECALSRGEGQLADNGALCVETGQYTGRSPLDRFIVDDPSCRDEIDWNVHSRPISVEHFEQLYRKALAYLQGRSLFAFDGAVGADPNYRQGVRVITELASHNLFARHLFQRLTPAELADWQADITVLSVPGLLGDPERDGIRSEAFVLLHLRQKLILIGGTRYAGEIKKSVFSLLNYCLTEQDVLPMHGAANIDRNGQTALLFGLSGTGKTTLSADPKRHLIGDDEHGWSANGIFNFEGGCYAKTIHLSPHHEPQIWSAIRFGTLLENVVLNLKNRTPDYDNSRLTENTRAAYPLHYISNCAATAVGPHPRTIIFLTADAFGVLPAIAKLTREQAMYHFLSGYTSKLAGTERGIITPQATFSACFGQVFFPRPAALYADMLGQRLQQHPDIQVYWVNTGWQGGAYGIGHRIAIKHTRAMVAAALERQLDAVRFKPHPIFNVLVPDTVPGVPTDLLDPQQAWNDAAAYQQQARELAGRFAQNFQQFASVRPEIAAAGPRID
jgi:phosphoenolpyruvate carboxykinase (ATP)